MGIELLLFALDPSLVEPAEAAGIDGFVIDWEWRGKDERQSGKRTQINRQGPEDLKRLRDLTRRPILCRLNAWGAGAADELECAQELGADELLLPMAREPEEVMAFLEAVAGRCRAGILVERAEAVAQARELARLPLRRVYVGLNDLAISRDTDLFRPLRDGTLEALAQAFRDVPFGFGGLTHPLAGEPIPSRLLLMELRRLACSFTFLRRSFMTDQARFGMEPTVRAIREAWAEAASASCVREARTELLDRVANHPVSIACGEPHAPIR